MARMLVEKREHSLRGGQPVRNVVQVNHHGSILSLSTGKKRHKLEQKKGKKTSAQGKFQS